jgi:transcriptional regulator with XRE-family HTH domain
MEIREMRLEAGFADRLEFCRLAGISPRTLSRYESGAEEPPRFLLMLLAMMAGGCRYCRQCAKGEGPCPRTTTH